MNKEKTNKQLVQEIEKLRLQISELEKSSNRQAENTARLRRAERVSKSGNWELYVDTQEIIASEGAARIYGVPKNKFKYKEIKKIPLAEYRSLLDSALNNAITKNEAYDIIFEIKTADTGEHKYIHAIAEYNPDKKILFGSFQDITQQKKMELELKKNEEENRMLLDLAPDSFFQGDTKGNLIRVNKRASALTGYSVQELLSLNISQLFDKQSLLKNPLDYAALKSGLTVTSEREIKRKDGQNIFVEMKSKLMPDQTYQSFVRDITERKEALETLRKSEEQLRLITENTTDNIAITTFDMNVIYTYVNPSVNSLLGYDPEDLIGKSFFDFVHPEDRKNTLPLLRSYVQKKIKKLLKTDNSKISETVEYRFKNKDGQWRYLQSTINVIGKQLLAVTRDVTERILNEQKLAESEARFRSLFEKSQAVMILVDASDGSIADVNQAACSFYGWKKSEFLKKNISQINTLPKATIQQNMREALLQGKNHFEFQHRLANGSVRDVDVYTGPVQFEHKDLLYSLVFDITDRNKAEQARAESELRFRSLFENNQAPMLLVDTKTVRIVDVNKAACSFYGWRKKEMLRMHMGQINTLPPKKINEKMAKAANRNSNQFEFQHKLANGTIRDVEVYSGPFEVKGHKLMYVLVQDITERKRTEEALYRSENKYRTLFEQTADALLLIKEDRFIDCNMATLQMLGYDSKDEFLGAHPSELSPDKQPDGKKSFSKANEMMQIAHENGSNRFEWYHKRKNGEVFPVEVLLTSIPSDEMPLIHVVWREISERKHAEKQLRENEYRLRMIVEGTPNLFFYTQDTDANITYISPSVQKITGRSVEEWKTKKDWFTVQSAENDLAKKITWRHLAGEFTTSPVHIEIEPNPGQRLFLEIYENPIIEAGKVTGLQGVAHDVTQRINADTALRESENRFRVLFENSPLGTYIATPDGTIVDGNPALLKILGSPSLEATKQINVLRFPPLRQNGYADKFKECVETGAVSFIEIPYNSKWNKEIFLSSYIIPLINEQGTVEKIYTIMEDISERKRAEEENIKLETQLRRSQKMETIGTLAGGIAHDFNNILAPIMGFTELAMLKIKDQGPLASDLNQVLKGVHRAKELVEQILLFSKQTEKERQALNLSTLVKEALKFLRPSIPTTIDIQQSLKDSCPVVKADSTQIHQVLVNLCTNAWQAMEKSGGQLRIELDHTQVDSVNAKQYPTLEVGAYARLSVIDTGPGMDEYTVERIFEPFFTTKAVDKGTGLGLSVVHGIVRSHNGDIQVYSEPGKGTAFHVYLPADESKIEIADHANTEIKGGSESILIVDDESAIAEMVQTILNNFGYKTQIFTSGIAAYEAFEASPDGYDLMISDLTMPQMTGLDLADKLHQKRAQFPVIIMTGFGDNLTRDSQKRYGVHKVLSKPAAVKELASAVRLVLDRAPDN